MVAPDVAGRQLPRRCGAGQTSALPADMRRPNAHQDQVSAAVRAVAHAPAWRCDPAAAAASAERRAEPWWRCSAAEPVLGREPPKSPGRKALPPAHQVGVWAHQEDAQVGEVAAMADLPDVAVPAAAD